MTAPTMEEATLFYNQVELIELGWVLIKITSLLGTKAKTKTCITKDLEVAQTILLSLRINT